MSGTEGSSERSSSPFLQAVEVWVPNGAGLRFRSGAYGPHEAFARASQDLTFESGQGLPGSVFRERRPAIWSELDQRFARTELAVRSGLDAAVAFPLFRGDELTSVVVLLCGSREHTGGCIELWQPNELRELALSAGYYGRLHRFAEISRLLRFQQGLGLPGITWQRGLPYVVPDLAGSTTFVRATAARASGVRAGLGIPLYRGKTVAQILLLLSAQATPLARAFEVWLVAGNGALSLGESYDERAPGFAQPVTHALAHATGEALASQVQSSGLPVAVPAAQGLPRPDHGAPYTLALGLPVHDGERLRAVVVILS
jgi:hypothetical protein